MLRVSLSFFNFLSKIRILLIFLSVAVLLFSFQNCSAPGDVETIQKALTIKFAETKSSIEIVQDLDKEYRVAFFVDVSQSMHRAACAGSIDTEAELTPKVSATGLGCAYGTGVDPEQNRWKIIVNFLLELESNLQKRGFTNDKAKALIIPFASTLLEDNYWNLNHANKFYEDDNSIDLKGGFLPVDKALELAYVYWSMEVLFDQVDNLPDAIPSKYLNPIIEEHSKPSEPEDKKGLPIHYLGGGLGTSMPLARLQRLNTHLSQELTALKGIDRVDSSHFEIVLLSDGVPKPHAKHIRKAVHKIWENKTNICDHYHNLSSAKSCNKAASCQFPECESSVTHNVNFVDNINASVCIERCDDYLRAYVDSGGDIMKTCKNINNNGVCQTYDAMGMGFPPDEAFECSERGDISGACNYEPNVTLNDKWGKKMRCEQCFYIVRNFDSVMGKNQFQNTRDRFKERTSEYWGDSWTKNKHSLIIAELDEVMRRFDDEYAKTYWRFNFVRMDSPTTELKTQEGELDPYINWFEKAKLFYTGKHRFITQINDSKPFELFPNLSDWVRYTITALYAVNINARVSNSGELFVDSDGDGLSDDKEAELGLDPKAQRSDGKCLDSLVVTYSGCSVENCSLDFDEDSDGLNECEEITAGTSPTEPDSDYDGIIDSVEFLFDLNPTKNDRNLDSNSDGEVNFASMTKGVKPYAILNSVNNSFLIDMQSKIVGERLTTNQYNQQIQTSEYKVEISSLPILKTVFSSNTPSNRVTVFAKIENFSNPEDSVWMMKNYFVNEKDTFTVDLSKFKKLKLEVLR